MSFAVVSLCIAWLTIKKNIKYHLPLLNRWTPPTAAAAERHPPPPPVRLPRPCASSHDPVPPPTQPFAPALEAVGASGCATRGDEGERKGEKLGFRLESSRDSDR
ncbi:Os03g0745500 [Oryza sativa Japonica Group]|nr:Os03g0745500 [Oryza sativa Japonica Group]